MKYLRKFCYLLSLFATSIIISVTITFSNISGVEQSEVIARFTSSNPRRIRFNRMTINSSRLPSIFIGATNWIIQLDLDTLNLVHNISMNTNGADHHRTTMDKGITTNSNSNNTDYHSKALVIDWVHEWLISCGTSFHGQCLIHNLNNISQIVYSPQESVVSDKENGSTVVFLAPGPYSLIHYQANEQPQNDSRRQPMVLYVGASWTSSYRSEIIASRSLNPEDLMHLAYSDVSSGTRLNIKNGIQNRFFLQYIYGFQSRGYAFFLVVRSIKLNDDVHLTTKLVRICQNDSRYYSYTEVPLHCDLKNEIHSHHFHPEETRYSKAQAAYFLFRNHSTLTSQTRESLQQEYLLVIFGNNVHNDHQQSSQSSFSSSSSALCIYPLWAIHRKFEENIAKCFDGQGVQNIAYVHTDFPPCQSTNMTLQDFACGSDVNQHLDTDDPIRASPAIVLNNQGQLTSIVANWIHGNIVAFLGTSQARIIKFFLKSNNIHNKAKVSSFRAVQYGQIDLVALMELETPEPIQSDMAIVDHFLYLMTYHKVFKIDVQQCSKHQNCRECFSSNDPYCGWCLSENKCSLKDDCHESIDWIQLNSVGGEANQCDTISSISPSNIAITTRKSISLLMKHFHQPLSKWAQKKRKIFCVFRFDLPSKTIMVQAQIKFNKVILCPSPKNDLLPSILPGNHFLRSWLMLAVGEPQSSKPDELSEIANGMEFNFYNCSTYGTCIECIKSGFECMWCISEHACKHNESSCKLDRKLEPKQKNDDLIATSCPQIAPFNKTTKFLVHEKQQIQVIVHVLNYEIQADDLIECRFQVPDSTWKSLDIQVKGIYNQNSSSIHCEMVSFTLPSFSSSEEAKYLSNISEKHIPLQVLVNHYAFDNPYNIHVFIYRCWRLAQTCGECLSLDAQLNCGWCVNKHNPNVNDKHDNDYLDKSSSCQISLTCPVHLGRPFGFSKWLNKSSENVCPNPIISDFHPKSGPIEGGTLLTIYGYNLGRSIEDINISVYLSKNSFIKCRPQKPWETNQFKCLLDSSLNSNNQEGPIILRIRNEYQTQSLHWYRFLRPRLSNIHPKIGPKSGGTLIYLYGQHLDSGSIVQVFLGETVCDIQYRNSSTIQCMSNKLIRSNTTGVTSIDEQSHHSVNISVYIDHAQIQAHNKFHFVNDPIVERIELIGNNNNMNSGHKVEYPCGIPSGGIHFMVKGKRFDSIQNPQFYVNTSSYGGQQVKEHKLIRSNCICLNSTLMICESPSIPEESIHFDHHYYSNRLSLTNYTLFDFGFIMDHVISVQSLSTKNALHYHFQPFHMFRQPQFYRFKEPDHVKKTLSQEYLTINGENLDLLSFFYEQVKIWIGQPKETNLKNWQWSFSDKKQKVIKNECNITSFSSNQLTCRLPLVVDSFTNRMMAWSNDTCRKPVQISIGSGYFVQMVGYVDYCLDDNSTISSLIIWISLGTILFLIILLLYFRLRNSQRDRKRKVEKAQMDHRQKAMIEEARNAYLALQLGVNANLVGNDGDMVVPCHSYGDYLLNNLIPKLQERQNFLCCSLNHYSNAEEDRLHRFSELIRDERFLLLFIRTLDKQNSHFPLSDRVCFGSYLVMALSNHLAYLTRIMLVLLQDLIDNYVAKSNPKLLLRRIESIVERIVSVWLTLLLYEYMVNERNIARSLYKLYLALKIHCYKEPVDEIINVARNTLSENQILRTNVTYKPLTILVSLFDDVNSDHQTSSDSYSDDEEQSKDEDGLYQRLVFPRWYKVSVLDCDTINQVIRKSLDTIYLSKHYSQRQHHWQNLDLEYIGSGLGAKHKPSRMILSNEDGSNERATSGHIRWYRLNTLAHYQIKDDEAHFRLVPKEFRNKWPNRPSGPAMTSSTISLAQSNFGVLPSPRARTKSLVSNPLPLKIMQRQQTTNSNISVQYWHLVKENLIYGDDQGQYQQLNNLAPEIFNNRRLSTKYTIQNYVDELFSLIFDATNNNDNESRTKSTSVCQPIKFIFDFFDRQAERCIVVQGAAHGKKNQQLQEEREQVCHIWKSNCLPLRFWVNITKNPEFLLDIEKDEILDSNLSVVAQTLMESCSFLPPNVGPNSPSSKLLYAQDFKKYNKWVHQYYDKVRQMNPISQQEMKDFFENFSRKYCSQIDDKHALLKLYQYSLQYRQQICRNMSNHRDLYQRFQSLFS